MAVPQQTAYEDPVADRLRQPRYALLKETRIIRAVDEATQLYERTVLGTTPAEDICVRPEDLETAHERGLRAATNAFDNNRDPPTNFDESDQFRRSLIDKYDELSTRNLLNNEEAVEQARRLYRSDMRDWCSAEPCTSSQQLEAFHGPARDKAFDKFKSKRTPYIDYSQDGYRTAFDTVIDSEYETIKRKNRDNNRAAIQTLVGAYEGTMKEVCAPTRRCLSPEDLNMHHGRARDLAMRMFNERRNTDYQDDAYKEDLLKELNRSFEELNLVNEDRNLAAVMKAYRYFVSKTEVIPNTASVIFANPSSTLPFAGPLFSYASGSQNSNLQRQEYERDRRDAIRMFYSNRLGLPREDSYYHMLTDLIRGHIFLKTIPYPLDFP